MLIATRTFRVFVSSTFEDLRAEGDALQRDVFPRLRKLCEESSALPGHRSPLPPRIEAAAGGFTDGTPTIASGDRYTQFVAGIRSYRDSIAIGE